MSDLPWWKTTTIYHIYPRSFQDSNGDGVGDLRGVIRRLDYIRDLGFETIWLSPFFDSPQRDGGYDVRDYCGVAPEYGTLADADDLIAEAHARGMRVLFDLVLNHTSDEHPWFRESRQSRQNPRRSWYIWRDGRGRKPPNNWKSFVGGSGWHFDPQTQQWYYASFLPFQPDLNYRNPQVKEAMFDVARFWLARGVDGFRLDIFHAIYKDAHFRDNPFSWRYIPNGEAGFFQRMRYNLHRPETFALARELRALAGEFEPERMLLGEVFGAPRTVRRYLGEEGDGLNLIFQWDLLSARPVASVFQQVLQHYEREYPAPLLPVLVWGNHDVKRVLSRLKQANNLALARLLALFQLTARGVPVVYYGEEIGMLDLPIPPQEAKDPLAQRYRWVPPWLADLLGLYLNRDGCRTPMQWDDSPNAGFCPPDAQPWLPVHPLAHVRNVEAQRDDPASLLNVYRNLLHLRREHPALHAGTLDLLDAPDLVAYRRRHAEEDLIVVFNPADRAMRGLPEFRGAEVLFAVGLESSRWEGALPPFSGALIKPR
ncbi:MAG: alpha-glucosidase [Anaerolineae bacterium]|nr:MAG: alpha-glucosidase [Anaerolineae bacterium]